MSPNRAAHSGRTGFTLVELAIVLTIAGIIIGIGAPRLQSAFHQRDVNGARDNVLLLSKAARARAMERSRQVRFVLDAQNDRALVIEGNDTIQRIDVAQERGVAIAAASNSYQLCYTARGFATQPCTTVADTVPVTFSRAGYSARMLMWPLGQVNK